MSRWIVDDDTQELTVGQMRKTEFVKAVLEALPKDVRAADGSELSPESCPSFAFWTRFYAGQDAEHIERALARFAGSRRSVTCARDYVAVLVDEVLGRRPTDPSLSITSDAE